MSLEPPRVLAKRRLGRAATFAFGAAVATTLACGDDSSPGADAGRLDSGGSSMDSGSSESDSGTSMDAGDRDAATAMDSGVDSGMSEDAGFDSGGGIMPPYGAPPPPPE